MSKKKISKFNRRNQVLDSDQFALAKNGVNEKATAAQILDYIKGKPFNMVLAVLDAVYPVGSLYVSAEDGPCPLEFSGAMHWEEISEGVCIQGAEAGQTPGGILNPGLPQILEDNQISAVLNEDTLYHTHTIIDYGHSHSINDGIRGVYAGKIHAKYDRDDVPGGSGNTTTDFTGVTIGDSKYEDFNINTESEIYGKSDTVQPAAFTVKIFKRVS